MSEMLQNFLQLLLILATSLLGSQSDAAKINRAN